MGCINTGDVIQELIAQVEELGIEINHTPLSDYLWYIFLTAIIVSFYSAQSGASRFRKTPRRASSHLWLQIITQNKLFHRLPSHLQG